jgi:hypothetical protein
LLKKSRLAPACLPHLVLKRRRSMQSAPMDEKKDNRKRKKRKDASKEPKAKYSKEKGNMS